ncbi:MAG: DegV family protein [Erysipelotrichaceae bacterium]|nr:DegV family protein [Erysipelotrichaceae bacterium]
MRIICDTAALIHPSESKEHGITILPLNVTISGNTYREFVDVEPKEFIELIKQGGVPQSSQPSVGSVMEAFESSDEEALVFAMADGLSGTYQTFEGVKQSMETDKITVVNTRTLAGPEHHIVRKAIKMNVMGNTKEEILEEVNKMIDHSYSFLIPLDFGFLQRGGRLSKGAAFIGGLAKIIPVLVQSDDGRTLEKLAMKRTFKGAAAEIAKALEAKGVDKNYTIYLCHGDNMPLAEELKGYLMETFPECNYKFMQLSPAFLTQGGPGCVAIQAVLN